MNMMLMIMIIKMITDFYYQLPRPPAAIKRKKLVQFRFFWEICQFLNNKVENIHIFLCSPNMTVWNIHKINFCSQFIFFYIFSKKKFLGFIFVCCSTYIKSLLWWYRMQTTLPKKKLEHFYLKSVQKCLQNSLCGTY